MIYLPLLSPWFVTQHIVPDRIARALLLKQVPVALAEHPWIGLLFAGFQEEPDACQLAKVNGTGRVFDSAGEGKHIVG